MSKKLRRIVKKIQYDNDWTIEEVAQSVGYSRVHLTREMKKEDSLEMEKVLENKFGVMVQNVSSQNKPMDIIANLTESNRMLAEATLILANKINSGEPGSVSLSVREEDISNRKDISELHLSGKIKPGESKKRRGILKPAGK